MDWPEIPDKYRCNFSCAELTCHSFRHDIRHLTAGGYHPGAEVIDDQDFPFGRLNGTNDIIDNF